MGNLDNHNFDGAEEAVLPREGEHVATVFSSEVGDTKNQKGTIVKLEYCLLDEPNGRMLLTSMRAGCFGITTKTLS